MSEEAAGAIERDVLAEGERLVGLAAAGGVPLRLLGGVAIRLRAPDGLPETLTRIYPDLDFAAAKKSTARVTAFFREAGYEAQVAFNALNGKERLLFLDDAHGRQVDVFVGTFRMSHGIPLADRLEVDSRTIPLAELLLTKLQVVELNEKDVLDVLALLYGHAPGEADGETINARRVAELCADDWGLWRTITANLAFCRERVDAYGLPGRGASELSERVDALLERIDREPKSRGWRLRAKIGERKRWYEVPEEVAGGP